MADPPSGGAKKGPFLPPCGAKSRGGGGAPPTTLILLRNQRRPDARRRRQRGRLQGLKGLQGLERLKELPLPPTGRTAAARPVAPPGAVRGVQMGVQEGVWGALGDRRRVSGRGRAAVAHGRSRGRAQSHGLATPKGGCPPGPEVALWAGANARQCPGIADRHSTPQDVALATSCSVPMSASPALRFRSEP